jgi:hypothetical protein
MTILNSVYCILSQTYHATDDNICTAFTDMLYKHSFSIRLSQGSAHELISSFTSIELNKINEHLGRQKTLCSPLHTVYIQYKL